MKPVYPSLIALLNLARGIVVATTLAFGISSQAEIVYDNTQTRTLESFFPWPDEFGDELGLGGTARTLTRFELEYYGQFTPNGAETVTIRIYANDGVSSNPGQPGTWNTPGTKLYQSAPISVAPGYNVLVLKDLAVSVPDRITWTMTSDGFTKAPGNRVGVTYYDPGTVGSSYSDFWVHNSDGTWVLMSFGGFPSANFGARIEASPDTPMGIQQKVAQTNGMITLQLNGPAYSCGILERSTNSTNWTALKTIAFEGNVVGYDINTNTDTATTSYRVRRVPDPSLMIASVTKGESNTLDFVVSGRPGWPVALEYSLDNQLWLPVINGYLVSHQETFSQVGKGIFDHKIYRARYDMDPPIYYYSLTNPNTGFTHLTLMGPPGRRCKIEYSKDLKNWQILAIPVFSFVHQPPAMDSFKYTFGELHFVDKPASDGSSRFYRASLLPPE